MVNNRILFIDDEIFADGKLDCGEDAGYMSYYVTQLRESGFEVDVTSEASVALKSVTMEPGKYGMAIIDIMMPPGELGRKETKNGIITGLILAQRIHEIAPEMKLVVLSNAIGSQVTNHEQLMRQGVLDQVFQKLTTTPGELADEIKDIFDAKAK